MKLVLCIFPILLYTLVFGDKGLSWKRDLRFESVKLSKMRRLRKGRLPEVFGGYSSLASRFSSIFDEASPAPTPGLCSKGLCPTFRGKNIESIAYRFEQDRQALQRFVGQTDWDHKPLLTRLAKQVAKQIGEDDGILAFDPSGIEKDGKKSAGVARQWLGRFGKVDNGQVGTFLAYVT